MKKFFYTLVLSVVVAVTISACTEETIQPASGGTNDEKCQFDPAGCPKS